MDNINISAVDFGKYLAVQRSGVANMLDVNMVKSLTGLPKEKILYIMKHYSELNDKYNK